jgi:hypothetical protein
MKSPLRSEDATETGNQTIVIDGLRAIATEEQPGQPLTAFQWC